MKKLLHITVQVASIFFQKAWFHLTLLLICIGMLVVDYFHYNNITFAEIANEQQNLFMNSNLAACVFNLLWILLDFCIYRVGDGIYRKKPSFFDLAMQILSAYLCYLLVAIFGTGKEAPFSVISSYQISCIIVGLIVLRTCFGIADEKMRYSEMKISFLKTTEEQVSENK